MIKQSAIIAVKLPAMQPYRLAKYVRILHHIYCIHKIRFFQA